jgi:hypothetical protein
MLIRPKMALAEFFNTIQHNRPDPDLSAWTFEVTRSIDSLGDHHNISKYLQADLASSDADAA